MIRTRARSDRASLLVSLLAAILMLENEPAHAQTQPDFSTWRLYEVPEHGVRLVAPPDWIQGEYQGALAGDIFSLVAPDTPAASSAGCGIVATPTGMGEEIDLDEYIEAMDEDRFLRALTSQYENLYLHKMEVVFLAERKSLHTVFSGDRKSGRWTHMNFDMAEGDVFYRLQCFFRPRTFNEYFLTFWAMAQSLEIARR